MRAIGAWTAVASTLAGLLCGGCAGRGDVAVEAASRPNVLFIAVDDLNDWVGHLGGRDGIQTPNLDRLADRGVSFTRAYAPAMSCTPSRHSVLTGMMPATTGVYGLIHHHWRSDPALSDVVTLPEQFRNAGYRTVGGGKIFHALSWIDVEYGRNQNDARAWDSYFPSLEKAMPDEVRPVAATLNENGAQIWSPVAAGGSDRRVPAWYFDFGPLEVPDSAMADHKVVDWAIEQLGRTGDGPFFIGVGIYRPHIPWFVPASWFARYPTSDIALPIVPPDDLEDLPPEGLRTGAERRRWHQWLVQNDLWEEAVQAYQASVTFTDAQVGRLLDALAASPHADNTIVVLWSDHGFHLGEKQTWEKFTLWEESARVPFIIAAPGMEGSGRRATAPVSLIDIFPTLSELTGIPAPPGLEGRSLVAQLHDPGLQTGRAVVSTLARGSHAVRSDRWRYIRYATGDEELYDHDADPGEHTNLAADPRFRPTMDSLATWLPASDAPVSRPR
ncbi:MAG: sulfatase [Gemmatimonadota bacterium]